MGRPLDDAVAIDVAAKDGARGLVLASTFASMSSVAKNTFPFFRTPLLIWKVRSASHPPAAATNTATGQQYIRLGGLGGEASRADNPTLMK